MLAYSGVATLAVLVVIAGWQWRVAEARRDRLSEENKALSIIGTASLIYNIRQSSITPSSAADKRDHLLSLIRAFEEAIGLKERLLTEHPDDDDLWKSLSDWYAQLGQLQLQADLQLEGFDNATRALAYIQRTRVLGASLTAQQKLYVAQDRKKRGLNPVPPHAITEAERSAYEMQPERALAKQPNGVPANTPRSTESEYDRLYREGYIFKSR